MTANETALASETRLKKARCAVREAIEHLLCAIYSHDQKVFEAAMEQLEETQRRLHEITWAYLKTPCVG